MLSFALSYKVSFIFLLLLVPALFAWTSSIQKALYYATLRTALRSEKGFCILYGAITGDIIGSVYEFNNIRTKDFELFSPKCSFTDDTVCTVAIADSILKGNNPVDALLFWCRKYPNAGYGDRFKDWIFSSNKPNPYNSFGNGAAMRISPIIHVEKNIDDLIYLSDKFTEITHNHTEGLKGARAIAVAGFMAKNKFDME